MRHLLASIFLILSWVSVSAQDVPNGQFEDRDSTYQFEVPIKYPYTSNYSKHSGGAFVNV